jgi:hypothetical protein
VSGQDRNIIMDGSTNGWQLLCIVVLLITAATAVGAAQSTETVNATSTSGAATTVDSGSSTPTGVPFTPGATESVTTTVSQSSTQMSQSDQATDDVPENATPIEVGERVTGQLPVGDQDWRQFSLESGGRLTLSVTAQDQTEMSAFIYSDRSRLESTYVDPGEQIMLTATADSAGQYYVFIRNEANDTAGAYAFEVSKSETPSRTTEGDAGNADGGNSGFGFWPLALLGAVILVGYLAFRSGGGNKESDENEGEESEDEEAAKEEETDGDDREEESGQEEQED